MLRYDTPLAVLSIYRICSGSHANTSWVDSAGVPSYRFARLFSCDISLFVRMEVPLARRGLITWSSTRRKML